LAEAALNCDGGRGIFSLAKAAAWGCGGGGCSCCSGRSSAGGRKEEARKKGRKNRKIVRKKAWDRYFLQKSIFCSRLFTKFIYYKVSTIKAK
jgi:hypothetical protein